MKAVAEDFLAKLRAIIERQKLGGGTSLPAPVRARGSRELPYYDARLCQYGGPLHCKQHPNGKCCWCEMRRAGVN